MGVRSSLLFIAGAFCLLLSCSDEDALVPNSNFTYFLVEDPQHAHNDSYVLALTHAEDITTARAMINNPALRQIIVAEITKDPLKNYYRNRDLLNNKDWSWHVSKFLGFHDTTIEIYDGWPQYVEDNYEEWVANTKNAEGNGVIGFWSYSITREVDPSELK